MSFFLLFVIDHQVFNVFVPIYAHSSQVFHSIMILASCSDLCECYCVYCIPVVYHLRCVLCMQVACDLVCVYLRSSCYDAG